jgi:hypothetical protein
MPLPTGPDLDDLRRARALLEKPGLAIQIANAIGKPVGWGLARLPERARALVASSTRRAMESALGVALRTLDASSGARPRDWLHRLAVAGSGALGGAVGLAGLPVELPISTVVMLRSIAEHARAQGEDLSRAEARMSCLMVFALGGRSPSDDAADAGYFAVRAALARTVAEVVEYVAERSVAEVMADRSAPALARLVAGIASRFGPAVADKVAAQLVPVVGAVGGAAINTLFIRHFQDMAWGHFTLRRLERRWGAEEVRAAYEAAAEPRPDGTPSR